MLIAYRRMSGAVGLTDQEKGSRGLWFEKRKALVKYLEGRGHTIHFVNRMTPASAMFESYEMTDQYDVLMIEFGSSNFQFYGDDLNKTVEMAKNFKGKVIFLNDDPDLPYVWKVHDIPHGKWACWYNCLKPAPFGGQPQYVPSYDFAFSSIQENREPVRTYQKDHLVYIGRPKGREPILRYLIAQQIPFRAYAKQAEWDCLGVKAYDPPQQVERADFYANQLGTLVLADTKHKKMGWRTGRAFHALLAGCPAIAEADHEALQFLAKFQNATHLRDTIEAWKDPDRREEAVKSQLQMNWFWRKTCDATAEACGL